MFLNFKPILEVYNIYNDFKIHFNTINIACIYLRNRFAFQNFLLRIALIVQFSSFTQVLKLL